MYTKGSTMFIINCIPMYNKGSTMFIIHVYQCIIKDQLCSYTCIPMYNKGSTMFIYMFMNIYMNLSS